MPSARFSLQIGAILAVALSLLGALHYVLPTYFLGEWFDSYARGWNDSQVWAMLYGYLLFFGLLPCLIGVLLGMRSLRQARLDADGRQPFRTALLGIVLNLAFLIPSLSLYLKLFRGGYFRFVFGVLPIFLDIPMPQGASLT